MKTKNIIVGIILIILAILIYKLIDYDKSRTLPLSQRVNSEIHNTTMSTTMIDHIGIIVMENKNYDEIVGSKNAPYINSLISQNSLTDNYFAVSHPSLPNYIALIGGSTFDITSDCTDCYINASNLVDQLEQAHKSWKAYMESMPSSCFIGSSGDYAQRHDPFVYFDNIRKNSKRCGNIVPYSTLSTDFQSTTTTPNFFFITPNLCNDMHNCPVSTGDTWLANNVPTILKSPAFTKQKSLLIITSDESEQSGDNRIFTLFIGNAAKHSFVSHTHYTHYSLLKTVEDVWSLPFLTNNVSKSNNMVGMLQ